MKTIHKILLFIFILSSLSLSACGPGHVIVPTLSPTSTNTTTPWPTFTLVDTATPWPTFTPADTATSTQAPTLAPTRTHVPSFIEPVTGTYRDWPLYIHKVYRFVFAVPPGWQVRELSVNFVQLSAPFRPDVRFTIGVRWVDEDVRIQRTGVPEGDIIRVGRIPFWGDEIDKMILVYQDKDKAVLYNNGTEFRVGDRYFTMGLGDFSADYASVNLAGALEETADAIVGSLETPK